MKAFPRIYSLSTLGLIHHNENDYLFHPLRTDFVGESGSGKSVVADLLQLITVGSDFYESATKGAEERKMKNMVLAPKGKGIGIGYTFINVEVSKGAFFVMGMYIETTTDSARPFIIQAGYGLENTKKIQTFGSPLLTKDFLDVQSIPNLEKLGENLENRQLVFNSWAKTAKYHQILFENGIIPMDLATNKRTLKDYASIIRSFSRGQGVSIKSSDQLKEFLFSTTAIDEIFPKYQAATKELEEVTSEYGRNRDEIEKIVSKQRSVVELKRLKTEKANAKKIFDSGEVSFNFSQLSRIQTDLDNNKTNLNDSTVKLVIAEIDKMGIECERRELKARAIEENINEYNEKIRLYQEAEKLNPELKLILDKRRNEHALKLSLNSSLEEVNRWVESIGVPFNKIRTAYTEYQDEKAISTAFLNFRKRMIDSDLWDFFLKTGLLNNFENGSLKMVSELDELSNSLEKIISLEAFADIDNPDSLAAWAIKLDRSVSLEEESTVIHFQSLPRKKPLELLNTSNRYLPDPDALFEKLKVSSKDKKGFWLDLGGVHEFIPITPSPILSKMEKSKLAEYLKKYAKDLKLEKERIIARKNHYEKLLGFLKDETFIRRFLENGKLFDKKYTFESKVEFELTLEEITRRLDLYEQRKKITKDFHEAKELLEEAEENMTNNSSNMRIWEARIAELKKKMGTDDLKTQKGEIERLKKEIGKKRNDLEELLKQLGYDKGTRSDLEKEVSSESNQNGDDESVNIAAYILFLGECIKRYNDHETIKTLELKTAREKFEDSVIQYDKLYSEKPLLNEQYGVSAQELVKLKEGFSSKTHEYNAKYRLMVDQFASDVKGRFTDSDDLMALVEYILPGLFKEADISENNVVDEIQAYLDRINEKNRKLSERKIQRIKDLLDEVASLKSSQLNVVRKIKNFLSHEDKKITGGYTAKLEFNDSLLFPSEWITRFKEEIDRDGFADSVQGKEFANAVSIEDKIKSAFAQFSGTRYEDVPVKRLLDPRSYYDLKFSMQSEDGSSNAGSTGQTYAALALLCIARISIIGNQTKILPGIRFIPIDEAEGLGSNFDMLYKIAKENDYQIISLSIGPVGKFITGDQFLYYLSKNPETEAKVNYPPMAIFSQEDIDKHPVLNG